MNFRQAKKNSAILMAACFLLLPLSAETLKTIKTHYFDIIYNTESASPSAGLLAEHADSFAEEICANLNKKIAERIPVYLVSDTESLNGYYTCMPYRRIVIYDTASNDGILANFQDTILNVFYHELTHAISLQSPLDYILPFSLFPMSFTEGAAVSFESLHGFGRLNDPLARQYLIQHKLDGNSPSWKEAAGLSDMYPGGLMPYLYGGFFAAYLQKKYGMTAYTQLWHLSPQLFIPSKFYSVYHMTLDTEWKLFLNKISGPAQVEKPQLFSSALPSSGYTVLAASSYGFAYYDFNKHGVFFVQKDISEEKTAKPKKLFSADSSLHHLSFSQDGNFMAVSDSMHKSGKRGVQRSRIFDMKRKRFIGKPIYSSRGACFIDESTLCAIIVKEHVFSAVLLDVETHVIKKTLYTAGQGKRFAALYSPCAAGNGTAAFIAANGVKRTILFVDTKTGSVKMLPESETPFAIRYLQAVPTTQGVVLSFSWAEKNMLYRLGLYHPETGVLKIHEKDVSGGVFFPVVLPYTHDQLSVVYAGIHRYHHQLYSFSSPLLTERILESISLVDNDTEKTTDSRKNPQKIESFACTTYHPAAWLGKIWFFPNFSVPNDYTDSGKYGMGLEFLSQDPTEKIRINSSFLIFPAPFFLHCALNIAAQLKPLTISFHLSDLIDTNLFSQRRTACGAGLSTVLPLRYGWEAISFSYNAAATWIAHTRGALHSYYRVPYRSVLLSHDLELIYNNSRSTKILKSRFFSKNTYGEEAALRCAHAYCLQNKEHSVVVEAKLTCMIPIIPITISAAGYFGINAFFNRSTETYTNTQSQLTVSATSYLPSYGVYNQSDIQNTTAKKLYGGCSILCDVTVFSYDMQTGSFFLPLFYNRIAVHAGYAGVFTGSFTDKAVKPVYFDTVYANVALKLNGVAEIGIEYAHPLRRKVSFGRIRAISRINL